MEGLAAGRAHFPGVPEYVNLGRAFPIEQYQLNYFREHSQAGNDGALRTLLGTIIVAGDMDPATGMPTTLTELLNKPTVDDVASTTTNLPDLVRNPPDTAKEWLVAACNYAIKHMVGSTEHAWVSNVLGPINLWSISSALTAGCNING